MHMYDWVLLLLRNHASAQHVHPGYLAGRTGDLLGSSSASTSTHSLPARLIQIISRWFSTAPAAQHSTAQHSTAQHRGGQGALACGARARQRPRRQCFWCAGGSKCRCRQHQPAAPPAWLHSLAVLFCVASLPGGQARSGQPVMNNGGWGRKRAHAWQRRAHTVLAGHLSTLHCANVVLAALHSLGASRSTASPAAGLPLVVRTPAGRAPSGSSQGLLPPSSRGPGQLPTLGGRSRQSGLDFACARPGSW